jgi:hypothetical protein
MMAWDCGNDPVFGFWLGLMGLLKYCKQVQVVGIVLGVVATIVVLFARKKSN